LESELGVLLDVQRSVWCYAGCNDVGWCVEWLVRTRVEWLIRTRVL